MKSILAISLLILSVQGFAQKTAKIDHIKFKLNRITVYADTLFFEMNVANHSLLNYKIQYVKFFIRDRHITTRTAVQEQEIFPLGANKVSLIAADSSVDLALDFSQFSIPKTKELLISLKERKGSRDLILRIKGKKLLRMIRNRE